MKCSEINQFLDLLMDDAISDEQMQLLRTHSESCPDCAESIRAAFEMKEMFAQMEEEVDVPLAAQAAWRRAVKAEASRKKMNRFYRAAGSVAAVAVLAIGIGWGINMDGAAPTAQPDTAIVIASGSNEETPMAKTAVIQADGEPGTAETESIAAARSMSTDSAPMHEYQMTVENVDSACNHISDITAEYEGTIEIQRIDNESGSGANIYLSLPSENVNDFMSAISHLDLSGNISSGIEIGDIDVISILLALSLQ